MNHSSVVIIGGGAAGIFAAIACAEISPGRSVTVLEAGRDFLGKVRISGGGRCNVTHHCFDPAQLVRHYPRGGKALRGAFSRFQPQDTIAWFTARGVKLKTEADGRIFPTSDDSQTIIDCLLDAAKQYGVSLRAQSPVRRVEKIDSKFMVTLKSGDVLSGDRLLIASGSSPLGHQWAQGLGHRIETPVPSLFTFNIQDPRLETLAGIAVEGVRLQIKVDPKTKLEQSGPVLITHWGLSGPVVLKLSAWGARLLHQHHYQLPLTIKWLPHHSPETIRALLLQIKEQQSRKQIYSFSPVDLPKRLWQNLAQFAGISASTLWADLSKLQMQALQRELIQGNYQIQGKGIFKEEFVTCGGVHLKEINFKTMESRLCPGLYFAGEVLDIDGVTGGFNFQSAWTTAWLAGQDLALG